jgi:hypothetical protein
MFDGDVLPYTVCKVSGRFEAWLRYPDWGGEQIAFCLNAAEARQACIDHWLNAPSPKRAA